jgi:hypothetical protein
MAEVTGLDFKSRKEKEREVEESGVYIGFREQI